MRHSFFGHEPRVFLCLQVTVHMDKSQAEPADTVHVTVRATPQSTAYLLAVDQSVLLLRSGNDITAGQVSSVLSLCLSLSVGLCLSVCLSIYLYISFCLSVSQSTYIYLFVCLSLSTCLFVCLSLPLYLSTGR